MSRTRAVAVSVSLALLIIAVGFLFTLLAANEGEAITARGAVFALLGGFCVVIGLNGASAALEAGRK